MIKPKQWEKDIQGGALCDMCGSDNPCGDITGCAWWTSTNKPRQYKKPQTFITKYP